MSVHDNSFHRFTINLDIPPPSPPPVKVSRVRLLLGGSNTGARLRDTFTAGLRARTPKWHVNLQWY